MKVDYKNVPFDMKGILLRIRGIWRLLVLFRVVWLGLTIAALTLFLCAMVNHPLGPHNVRYAGMMNQLFGLACVAFGLGKLQAKLGKQRFGEKLNSILRQIFGRRRRVVIQASDTMHLSSGGAISVGVTAHRDTSDESLDHRVSRLEKKIESLNETFGSHEKQVRKRLQQVNDGIKGESGERRREVIALHELIREISIGGLHIEGTGLVLLASGVIMSSIPQELATLLAWLHPVYFPFE